MFEKKKKTMELFSVVKDLKAVKVATLILIIPISIAGEANLLETVEHYT